jgi:hypothetical protein
MIAARIAVLIALLAVPAGLAGAWIHSADTRLTELSKAPAEQAPVASASDVAYCSPDLKRILRRVLMSCGLVGGNAARGCQPVQAKNVATMTGHDFNAVQADGTAAASSRFDGTSSTSTRRPHAGRPGVRRPARRELVLRRRAGVRPRAASSTTASSRRRAPRR